MDCGDMIVSLTFRDLFRDRKDNHAGILINRLREIRPQAISFIFVICINVLHLSFLWSAEKTTR